MKISYTGDIAGPCDMDVPNALVKDLLQFVLNTSQWKLYPEVSHEQLIRFRKRALESGTKKFPEPQQS